MAACMLEMGENGFNIFFINGPLTDADDANQRISEVNLGSNALDIWRPLHLLVEVTAFGTVCSVAQDGPKGTTTAALVPLQRTAGVVEYRMEEARFHRLRVTPLSLSCPRSPVGKGSPAIAPQTEWRSASIKAHQSARSASSCSTSSSSLG